MSVINTLVKQHKAVSSFSSFFEDQIDKASLKIYIEKRIVYWKVT